MFNLFKVSSLTIVAALVCCAAVFAAPTGSSDPVVEALQETLHVRDLVLVDVDPLVVDGRAIEVVLPLGGAERRVVLQPHSVRSDSFSLMVTDAAGEPYEVEPDAPRTYRGSVAGYADSIVAAGVTPTGGLRALIVADANSEWAVQPVPEEFAGLVAGDHVIYRTADCVAGDWTCGSDDLVPAPDTEFDSGGGNVGYAGGASLYVCQIACDADNEYYDRNGSDVGATMADIEQIINAVDVIYERDVEIVYEITTILVRTTEPDPYSSSSSSTLLNQFRNHWRSSQGGITRDIAQLFTGKNLDGSVIGVAYLGRICSSTYGYGLVESKYTPNFVFRTSLSAHELGHNWNSSHCSGSDCRIMCPSNGGCTGDVTRFGASSQSQIISHRNSRGCLDQIQLPDPLTVPFSESWTGTSFDPDVWPGVDGATIDSLATNEPSPPFALRLGRNGGDNDQVESWRIDLENAGVSSFYWYWVQGKNLEPGDRLGVDYFDRDYTWKLIENISSNNLSADGFRFEYGLLQGERHDRFALRFRSDVDDSNDTLYVDDIGIAETRVTVDLVPMQAAVQAGEFYEFDVSLTNVTGSTQGVDAWIDVFRPDSTPLFAGNPKFGPKSVSLQPFATKSKSGIRFRVPASTPPDFFYRVVAYVGTSSSDLQYADDLFFQVGAP